MEKNKTKTDSGITRREFIGAASAAAVFTIVPRHVLGGKGHTPPSDKLNIAGVGVGGQGYSSMMNVSTENVAFLCDVDDDRAAKTYKWFHKAKRYHDFRRMLDREHKNIDAVVVTTPNHTHVPVCVMAMRMGKHVLVEKPLGHNIEGVRTATEVARESGVSAEMGAAGRNGSNYRRVVELVRAGAIGEIKEVHVWCDNEWDKIPRKVADSYSAAGADRRPQGRPPVPKSLDWDLWLGPAPYRPYHPRYVPRQWRGFWAFGGGRLADMGCHFIDLPYWALDLKYPLTVETEGPGRAGSEFAPPWLITRWTFPARGALPPVTLTWYDGNQRPVGIPKEVNPPDGYGEYGEGILFIGDDGMILSSYDKHKFYPEEKFASFERPPQTIPPSVGGQFQDWVRACKAGRPGVCSFDYAGPMTETVLLGNVAYRTGEKLHWDPANLKATNCAEADRFIGRKYRKGWEL